MNYEAFKQETSAIERDAGLLSVHHSPDFQCDQTDGFPTSLCWADGKAWLELNRSLIEDGEDVSYPAMGLSLTFDHRALDGAPAAKFLKELCFALENFNLLLLK